MSKTNDTTIESYNKGVDSYIAGSVPTLSEPLRSWIENSLAAYSKDARILEIGSGTGKDAAFMQSLGYTVDVTDASTGFVDYLRTSGFAARELNVLRDEIETRYDVVFADAVFLHFTETELGFVFKKLFKVLTPDGSLVFSVKEGEGEEMTERKVDGVRYFHYWLEDPLVELLKHAGFKEVAVSKMKDRRPEKPDWLHIVAQK